MMFANNAHKCLLFTKHIGGAVRNLLVLMCLVKIKKFGAGNPIVVEPLTTSLNYEIQWKQR